MAKTKKQQLGELPPQYNFSLNPYPDLRFSSCPDCGRKTGQRKLPLLIHIDPGQGQELCKSSHRRTDSAK